MNAMHQPIEIIIPSDRIEAKILFIRGRKVIMDKDLAVLYGVETRTLNQAVRRNIERFPEDFMFQLSEQEMKIWMSHFMAAGSYEVNPKSGILKPNILRSQFVISKGGRKYKPFVFTEQGVAMLSSVLNSKRAIHVNIQIMRTFTRLREMLATNKELREKIEKLEKRYDGQFKTIFGLIKQLLAAEENPKPPIGFKLYDK